MTAPRFPPTLTPPRPLAGLSQDFSDLSSPGCRFFRELRELKTFANYATCDRSNLADWLGSLDPRFRQYTYGLVSCGLDRSLLHRVSEQQLLEDCGIHLGVHRMRILMAARGQHTRVRPTPVPYPPWRGEGRHVVGPRSQVLCQFGCG